METEGKSKMTKRIKISEEEEMEKTALTHDDDDGMAETIEEGTEDSTVVSEQMELEISHIQEKINQFSQLVSKLLESGKSMLSELMGEFEGRIMSIYMEQLEKWEEEIKQLRLFDASNEEMKAVLQHAKCVFQNVPADS